MSTPYYGPLLATSYVELMYVQEERWKRSLLVPDLSLFQSSFTSTIDGTPKRVYCALDVAKQNSETD
jgi:hypothetical protein